jgi:hypothetical protein
LQIAHEMVEITAVGKEHSNSTGRVKIDLSSLGKLGEVAGVAGIAIGMIALIARAVIDRTSSLPRAERAPMFRLVTTWSFAIGAFGILAWLLAIVTGVPNGGRPTGNCNIASGGIASGGNSVNCSSAPSALDAKP